MAPSAGPPPGRPLSPLIFPILGACIAGLLGACLGVSAPASPVTESTATPLETARLVATSQPAQDLVPSPTAGAEATPLPERILIDYFQSLGRGELMEARQLLIPEARVQSESSNLAATTEASPGFVVTQAEVVEAAPELLVYCVTFLAGESAAPQEQPQLVELHRTPEGWRIAAVTAEC